MTKQETAICSTNVGKKKRSGRAGGRQNYNMKNINVLFKLVDKHVPIKKSDLSRTTSHYNIYGAKNKRFIRDLQGPCIKFDRLASTKKLTGDPSCPEFGREAMRLACDILSFEFDVTVDASDL